MSRICSSTRPASTCARASRCSAFYSPQIQQAQTDLLVAIRAAARHAGIGCRTASSTARCSGCAISVYPRAASTKCARPAPIRAPSIGRRRRPATVIDKRIINGQRVVAGDELYRIVDLSNVWVIADVAEGDLADIKLGTRATVTFRAYRNQPVEGVVTFIYPEVRTGNAHRPRAHRGRQPGRAAEAGHVCRRGVPCRCGRRRRSPPFRSAPLSTAARGKSCWWPRAKAASSRAPVKLGRRGDGYVEIVEGLKPGEEIVTSATFLIDAESNLQSGAEDLQPSRSRRNDCSCSSAGRRATFCWSDSPAVFLTLAGLYAVSRVPLDAIPDLSDVQVIVYTEYPGQAPQVVEDQVTYPLTTAMLSVPKSRVVRGFSFFGVSFVYVIFEDGTDLYWARSRVLEYLNSAAAPAAGRCDAEPRTGRHRRRLGLPIRRASARRRTSPNCAPFRIGTIRYGLAKAEGVAEVAERRRLRQAIQRGDRSAPAAVARHSAVEGPRRHPREQHRRRRPHGRTVRNRIRRARPRLSARALPISNRSCVKSDDGMPVLLRTWRASNSAPDERRGITELNGEGEVVTGIVLAALRRECALRHQEREGAARRNRAAACRRASRIDAGLRPLGPHLPRHRHAQAHADRGKRHRRAGLRRLPAARAQRAGRHHHAAARRADRLSRACTCLGLSSNIMSLGGIAIAIGAMVDAAIVMIENAHKQLERAPPGKPRSEVLIEAAIEVGPALFFSLLVITVSFLPIFTLEAQEGRMFKPLAYTKTFAMAAAALLSVTLVPALMMLFVRGRIMPEHKNPVNRVLIWVYRPVIRTALRFKAATIADRARSCWSAACGRPCGSAASSCRRSTRARCSTCRPRLPGLSVTKAAELLQTQDKIIKTFPEVASVFGKAGRASDRHRSGADRDVRDRDQSEAGERMAARHDDRQADRRDGQGAAVSRRLQRLDHADQGAHRHAVDRHPHAGRGQGLRQRSRRDRDVSHARSRPSCARCRARPSAFAERIIGGYYLDIEPDRAQLARYGLMIGDVQDVIATALGGEAVTTTVEGRERYSVNIRYPRDLRSDPQAIATQCSFRWPDGGTVPLGEVAKVELGPRAVLHPHRERAARRLYLCRHARPRSRRLRRRRAEGGGASRSSSRPATTSPGAANSNTWSAPRRG